MTFHNPSIIVNSGNGVHLYWLLDTPYEIDDVGMPPPVLFEQIEGPDGVKRWQKHTVLGGRKVYLHQRHAPSIEPHGIVHPRDNCRDGNRGRG